MRILVVCGAGASSTFVAQRLRRAAQAHGLDYAVSAGTAQSLPVEIDGVELLLVGPHVAVDDAGIRELIGSHGVPMAVLPGDVFADLSGERTLEIVRGAALSAVSPVTP